MLGTESTSVEVRLRWTYVPLDPLFVVQCDGAYVYYTSAALAATLAGVAA